MMPAAFFAGMNQMISKRRNRYRSNAVTTILATANTGNQFGTGPKVLSTSHDVTEGTDTSAV